MAKILFATDANGVKFYTITITDAVVHIKNGEQKKLTTVLDDIQNAIDDIDFSGKADKVANATNGNFAGLDANGNLTDSGKKAADFDTAGAAATAQANAEATAAADATSKVNAAKEALIGDDETDTKASDTITGAKKYAKSLADNLEQKILDGKAYQGVVANQDALPTNYTANDAGKYYILTNDGNGKFAYWNGTGWDLVDQETAVSSEDATLVIGTPTKVAEVEGVNINVTQAEDMTKIEAMAVADTTEYPDVTALFTAGE